MSVHINPELPCYFVRYKENHMQFWQSMSYQRLAPNSPQTIVLYAHLQEQVYLCMSEYTLRRFLVTYSSLTGGAVSGAFALGRGVGSSAVSTASEGRGVSSDSPSASESAGCNNGDDSGGVWNTFFSGDLGGPVNGEALLSLEGVTTCVTGSVSDVTAVPS